MGAVVPIEAAGKLAPLIARLSSDSDGEVVACVRAIDRQLRKHGASFNDLATVLTCHSPATADTLRTYPEATEWLLARAEELTAKELRFVHDMRGILRRYPPRPKQARWLVALVERLGGEWAGLHPEAGYG